jgi:hypothetical protein
MFAYSVILLAYSLRIFERPLSAASKQDFHFLGNSIWMVIVTMTTVGNVFCIIFKVMVTSFLKLMEED